MAVKPIPQGYHTVTPYLIVKRAAEAIEFYKKAFGAEEILRMAGPDGTISHAEIKIGNSMIMLGEEAPAMDAKGRNLWADRPWESRSMWKIQTLCLIGLLPQGQQ